MDASDGHKQIPPPNQPKRQAMGVKPGIGTVIQIYNIIRYEKPRKQLFFDE
jgi:hypothetical protein